MAKELSNKQLMDFDEKMERTLGIIGTIADSVRSDCFF